MPTDTLEANTNEAGEVAVESQLDALLDRINRRGDDPIEGLPDAPKPPAPLPIETVQEPVSPGDALIDEQVDQALANASQGATSAADATAQGGSHPGAKGEKKQNGAEAITGPANLDDQLSMLLTQAQTEAELEAEMPTVTRPENAEPEADPTNAPELQLGDDSTDALTIKGDPAEGPADDQRVPGVPAADDGAKTDRTRPEARVDPTAAPASDMSIDELDELIAGEDIAGDFETVDAVVSGVDPAAADPVSAGETESLTEMLQGPSPEAGVGSAGPRDGATGAVGLDPGPAPATPSQSPAAKRDLWAWKPWLMGLLERWWVRLAVMPDLLGLTRLTLARMNLPLYRLPDWARKTVGYAALLTLFNALWLLVYAWVS